ncbi:MAG: YbgC/FadM family acyl-CoA thioesterase [Planctomycetota bacterium]
MKIFEKIQDALVKKSNFKDKCQIIVEKLRNSFPHYNWVGIYMLEDKTLKLLVSSGDFETEHTLIPIDKGICGKAIKNKTTIIVPDVTKSPEYLPCSVKTKSEIVVPIGDDENIIGEIDIDGYKIDAFSEIDRAFLEDIAKIIYRHYLLEKKVKNDNILHIRVAYKDTDKMGIVHHANYIEYCERARVETIRKCGLSYKQIEEMGTLLVVGEINLKILKSAYYDDLLTIKTHLVELTPIKVVFEYNIFNDKNELIVFASTNLYPLNSVTRKLKRLDNFIISKLSTLFEKG